jgi:hypothetical protein
MIIGKRLKGKAIAAWLGGPGEAVRRAVSTVRAGIANEPRKLEVYLDIGDPWSYLTAQAVSRLVQAYPLETAGVELVVRIVTPPASDVDGNPELRTKHAVRDAHHLADYWDLEFPGKKEADPGIVRDVATSLIRERPAAEQLRCFLDLTGAMWAHDRKKLAPLLLQYGTEAHLSVPPILAEQYAALRKAGHYQGAMIHYKDTWYWGIDRLHYLEAELGKDLGVDVAHVVTPKPETDRGAAKLSEKPLTASCGSRFARRTRTSRSSRSRRCSRRTTCRSRCGRSSRWSRAACRCRR